MPWTTWVRPTVGGCSANLYVSLYPLYVLFARVRVAAGEMKLLHSEESTTVRLHGPRHSFACGDVARLYACQNKVLDAKFMTLDRYVTLGVKHMWFWDPSPVDSTMEKKRGVFGKYGTQTLMCACPHPVDPESTITGTAKGAILVWKGRNCVRSINAHKVCA